MMNPFNPAFGSRPERFIGRDDIAMEIVSAVDDLNSPWRTTLITGVRGSGKTALLSDIEKRLRHKDCVVVTLIPGNDFLDNVLQSGKSVVFLIDETQKHDSELRTFIGTYQILIRQEYPVSLAMAGLPNIISDILNDSVLTFLRRAHRITLQKVPGNLVQLDYLEVFKQGGFQLNVEQLRRAVIATQGYPYLIQLIGYYLWIELERNDNIDYAIEKTISLSKNRLFINVHDLIYNELSDMDQKFVSAMAVDEGDSNMIDVMKRLGKERNYVSNYRKRLLAIGLISKAGHGKVRFALPYMREYMIQLKEYEDF